MTAMRTMGLAPVNPPTASVEEKPCGYTVRLPVNGFARDELEVEVSDHLVTVRGDQKRTPADVGAFRLHERLEETFKLPADADTTRVSANFRDGALVFHIPRSYGTHRINPDASGV